MPIEILMPMLSPTMKSGHLVRWHKKEGEVVSSGDVIFEIETDKAIMEVEATSSGALEKILIAEKTEEVPVNSLVAIMRDKGDTDEDIQKYLASCMEVACKNSCTDDKNIATEPGYIEEPCGGRVLASPLARRIAEQEHIDLSNISGTGPMGRVVKKDIEKHLDELVSKRLKEPIAKSAIISPVASYNDIPISSMRRVIADVLTFSSKNIPHFNLSVDCNVGDLLQLRAKLNNSFKDAKISVTDMITRACAISLEQVPELNSSWQDTHIRQYSSVDIVIAVSVDGGIMAPVIRNAAKKSLRDISAELKVLIAKSRAMELRHEESSSGTFSISNLGMLGVDRFDPIVTPNQSGILAIGSSVQKPVVRNGNIEVGYVMTATVSADHRIVDGAIVAKFLNIFRNLIEDPVLLLA